MSEYEMKALIEELGKLIVSKQSTIDWQNYEIKRLKAEVRRLEELLTPTIKESDKPLTD